MDFIKLKHVEKNAKFMTEKGEEYLKESKRYAELGLTDLASWYEGRGDAFITAAEWLRMDIEVFAENIDDPIAHLIGETA